MITAILVGLIVLMGSPVWAIFLAPTDDVKSIINTGVAGTTYEFTPGVYRTGGIIPKSDMQLIGQSGVVIDGSVVVTNWQQVSQTTVWAHADIEVMIGQ